MERVTKEHIHSIPESLANELVTLGSAELTAVQVSIAEGVCVCGGGDWVERRVERLGERGEGGIV